MYEEIKLYFEKYLQIGLKPILLFPNSKKPIFPNWNKNYNCEKWKKVFESRKEQNYNIGILLGDIVDVEADTEESNELLNALIGNYQHPVFQSSRSIHHIFLNPDVNLTVNKFYGIEFRGNQVQSVFPPSLHVTGEKYKFLKSSSFPIPAMPKELLDFYWRNKKNIQVKNIRRKQKNKKNIRDGFRKTNCNLCKKNFILHEKRLLLEVQAFLCLKTNWCCKKCRKTDIKKICQEIRFQSKFK